MPEALNKIACALHKWQRNEFCDIKLTDHRTETRGQETSRLPAARVGKSIRTSTVKGIRALNMMFHVWP